MEVCEYHWMLLIYIDQPFELLVMLPAISGGSILWEQIFKLHQFVGLLPRLACHLTLDIPSQFLPCLVKYLESPDMILWCFHAC